MGRYLNVTFICGAPQTCTSCRPLLPLLCAMKSSSMELLISHTEGLPSTTLQRSALHSPLLCAKVSSSSHDGVSLTRSPTGPLICTLQLLPLKERCHLCCLPHFLMSSFPRRKEWRYFVEAHPLSTFPLHHVETSYNLVVRTVSRGHKTGDICT